MEFEGSLFTYYEPGRLTAFESGPKDSSKTVVFVGGLGDGFNAVPFLVPLNKTLNEAGWSLIQVYLSSSYSGYGISNLQKDTKELDYLVRFLCEKRGKSTIVFLGHSTGSQDCYWHNKYGETRDRITGYILQAPVSDREYMQKCMPDYQKMLRIAKEMRAQGKGQHLMPIVDDTPITADRYYSLAAFGGDDDVFSSDLPDDVLEKLYSGVERPMMLVHGSADECFPDNVSMLDLLERFKSFSPAIKRIEVIPDGDHCYTDKDAQQQLISVVMSFLDTIA
ncbi:uncharacterized protein BYT42DRAFT_556714 [Radiomyces spectabilis]|uniref:uncharacterized protein n=1 Tax=Radiomyces spectabilis TaxID=64574 RepID=UPI00221F639D|nr:uncharacterized protein BYT42DRAFT_556714 [Radiomyces spectabilis]KAI8391390.1 hypothetical protein BYT42DRAFT_556714 [Radiomyces spectabilis]